MDGQPNPYAPPVAEYGPPAAVAPAPAYAQVWRDGDVALCPVFQSQWPDRCVRCNAPAQGNRLDRALSWHPPYIYLLLLAGILVYVIVGFLMRKSARVHVGLCPKHRAQRRWVFIGTALGLLATSGSCVAGINHNSDPAIVLSVLAFAAVVLVGAILAQPVRPTKIDERFAWIKVGKPFLESLPQIPYGPNAR